MSYVTIFITSMSHVTKGLIKLYVVSLAFFILPRVFHFSSRFPSRFRYQHVGIQNASENVRKMQQKREKNPKREKVFLYYTMRWAKTRVSHCFAHALLAFCLRFACVLLAFCLHLTHKLYQNANPTHSIIWA